MGTGSIFDGVLFSRRSHRPTQHILPVVRAEAVCLRSTPGPPSLAHELATGTRHLMPVGQSGRTLCGEDRCVHSLPPICGGSAKIPLRDFYAISAKIPTGLGCAGLFYGGPLALMGIMCSGPRVEATP